MTRKFLVSSLAAAVIGAVSVTAHAQSARDSITIVGSSTVYPFTTTVAEQFGRQGKFKTPKVESTGTGGGIKLFCNGVGPQFPDIANASRRIRPAELATCAQNGVKEVVEVKVGYDGIVIAENKGGASLKLTRKDVYLALAKNGSGSGESDHADRESVHHVEGRQQVAAGHQDRSARPAADLGHARFVRRAVHGSRLPHLRLAGSAAHAGRAALQARLRHDARGRRVRRSRRERQPHRAEARRPIRAPSASSATASSRRTSTS